MDSVWLDAIYYVSPSYRTMAMVFLSPSHYHKRMTLKLTPKDKVAIVCASTYYGSEQQVQDLQAFLRAALHCEVIYTDETFNKLSAKERAANFLSVALDPSVKAIWALRGGEGGADLLPYIHLQLDRLKQVSPKFLIGFSDFTPLIIYFHQQLNWHSIHAIAARQLLQTNSGIPIDDISFDALRELLLFNAKPKITELVALNTAAQENKIINAHVVGGNISLLNISVKDVWQPSLKNKIVLLEEVNEPAYRLGRDIKYLDRVGFFDGAAALLFAGCYKGRVDTPAAENFNAGLREFITEFAAHSTIPVLYTPQVGHESLNLPIPFYLPAELQLGAIPELKFID